MCKEYTIHSASGAANPAMCRSASFAFEPQPGSANFVDPPSGIEDEYELGRVLGSGMFSTVRLGKHRLTKINVAIKVSCCRFFANVRFRTQYIYMISETGNQAMLVVVLFNGDGDSSRTALSLPGATDQFPCDSKTANFLDWSVGHHGGRPGNA
jgi:serine/threonine protein kinase